MITRNERIIVEAVRRASSMSIRFNGVEIYVRNGEFSHDVAIALQFSLSGLEKITGVSQAQLGHFLHGRRKPSRKTITKIQNGVDHFAKELTAIKFA